MYSEKKLNDLLQLIYQAAADSERWPAFLEQYQATVAARNLALVYEAPDQKRSLMFATGADEADIQKYHQYPCPWLNRLVEENCRAGGADASHHLITNAELEKTECFSQAGYPLDSGDPNIL